jgi:alkanesulfonate monooxygenase SsuD/methylene tetrahydromethanopterin reductase-like flavin-dependent oxidoreductase (luciferase family)
LWAGGPVTRESPFFPLCEAAAYPIPDPAPRIVIGGETAAGARLAGRIGDGWTAFDENFEKNLPLYLEAVEASGRRREDQVVYVGFERTPWLDDFDISETEWCREPTAAWERWQAAGADGAVVLAKTTSDIDALVDAVAKW